MNYQAIIDKYYPEDDQLRQLLLKHSRQVTDRCLDICSHHPEWKLNLQFIEEAAMLHDIGIRWCNAPGIFCLGSENYIRHGIIGAQLLRQKGLLAHARVCERHTGTGITREQIALQHLPLPVADYVPETLEEQIICYADKFYSKSKPNATFSVEQVAASLAKFGTEGVEKFLNWAAQFESAH